MNRDKKWSVEEIAQEVDGVVAKLKMQAGDVLVTGTRVVILIHRAKEGGSSEEDKRREMTRVIHSEDSLRRALYQMIMYARASGKTLRIYMTANSRDLKKSLREMKRRLLELEYADEANQIDFMKKMYGRWDSCLMEYASRASSYFMFDIDNMSRIEEVQKFCGENDIEIVHQYPTKNGYHILTKPFNSGLFNEIKGEVELQKDGQLLVWFS